MFAMLNALLNAGGRQCELVDTLSSIRSRYTFHFYLAPTVMGGGERQASIAKAVAHISVPMQCQQWNNGLGISAAALAVDQEQCTEEPGMSPNITRQRHLQF